MPPFSGKCMQVWKAIRKFSVQITKSQHQINFWGWKFVLTIIFWFSTIALTKFCIFVFLAILWPFMAIFGHFRPFSDHKKDKKRKSKIRSLRMWYPQDRNCRGKGGYFRISRFSAGFSIYHDHQFTIFENCLLSSKIFLQNSPNSFKFMSFFAKIRLSRHFPPPHHLS